MSQPKTLEVLYTEVILQYIVSGYEIDLDEVESYIKQKPNKHILFVFRFHLAVYNLAHIGKERKWKTKLGNIVGEEPVVYDVTKTKKSSIQIKSYFKNKGY